MSERVVFLTGATGALGSWIAAHALADGMHVRTLARADATFSARQRVERSIAATGKDPPLARLDVLDGDFVEDNLDVDGVGVVIHCAACTAFQHRFAEDSRRTNVDGLRRILDFAARARAAVVHFSTAYVCGNRGGVALEDELDVGQRFNNVYERTKCQGESLVHEWSKRTGQQAIVIRPGIVLGDWIDGRTARFSTLYHLMAALDSAGASLRSQQLRLIGNDDVTKNIIPVDYFAQTAWQVIRRANSGTYQIVHPNPISMAEMSGIFSKLFNIDLKLVRAHELQCAKLSTLERTCNHVMAPYRAYMTSCEPHFDQRRTRAILGNDLLDPPKLNLDYFHRLLAYAQRVNWGREDPAAQQDDAAERVEKYFDGFLSERTNENLLPDLKRLTACFGITMKDHPKLAWWLDVQEGVLRSVSREHRESACSYTLDSATFLKIAAGALPPQRAFFMGHIHINGNIEMGLKVATVLAKFFSAYPYITEEVHGHAQAS